MFQHLPGGQYWKVKEGRGNAYIKCRLGTNAFTSKSEILQRAQTSFLFSEKISIFKPSEPKERVEFLKGTNRISGTAHTSDYFSSWRRQYAMRMKASFWLPDLYQCRSPLDVFNVKMHVYRYRWKDRRIHTSNDLGCRYRKSFTSQAFPHGAQSKSNCQKFPSITKIYA